MSNNALRTARKVWKRIKYELEDRSVLELGSADDDLIEEIDAGSADDDLIEEIDAGSADDGLIEEIDADQIKDIEKAIINALRTLTATGSWPVGHRDP